MRVEELTPAALGLLRRLSINPSQVADGPLLHLLLADRLVMGSPDQVHLTSDGKRLLAAYEASLDADSD